MYSESGRTRREGVFSINDTGSGIMDLCCADEIKSVVVERSWIKILSALNLISDYEDFARD